jgi:histidyl-tRNA synthetase
MQFDADTVGSGSMAADAEICMMAADIMDKLGIERGAYVVRVNNRKLLDGILEANGLGGESNTTKRLIVLRAIDKVDRLGPAGVKQLLGEGRRDPSGDFTRGAELKSDQIDSIMRFVEWKRIADDSIRQKYDGDILSSNADVIDALSSAFGANETSREALNELRLIAELVDVSGYKDRVRIDPSVVRGLEYYTGPVYEVELYINDETGRAVSFGSVGGGGRYDGLVSRFRGESVPATGFSIGVSRLQVALASVGKLDTTPEFGPVVVTVFDRDRVADYQKMVAALRNANIRAELYLGNPKNMGNQLKYADRRNSPCVIIQGSDEKARGEVQIKDLIEGAKAAAAIASNQEWRETRPAQFSCREDEIIAKVREVLARHDVKWG